MSDRSTEPDRTKLSRREMIAGAAGAVGVLALKNIVGAGAADAASGGNVVLGQANSATGDTAIENTALDGNAFGAQAVSGAGFAVEGSADSGDGVYGASTSGVGVHGQSFGNNHGVYGQVNNANASGVYGQNVGTAYGVVGTAASGTGVLADSSNGTALAVNGKAQFSQSGKATVRAGTSSKKVKVAKVSTSSMILATSQQNATVTVRAAVPAAGSFTIHLTGKAPTAGLKVAWFVLN